MFDEELDKSDKYYDYFESNQYRSRMRTLDWSQWGKCPTCDVGDGEICIDMKPVLNHERVKRFRMRPHWERWVILFPMCETCDAKGYFVNPLRNCSDCGGKGQRQGESSQRWWYDVYRETGENLWALNSVGK